MSRSGEVGDDPRLVSAGAAGTGWAGQAAAVAGMVRGLAGTPVAVVGTLDLDGQLRRVGRGWPGGLWPLLGSEERLVTGC